MLIKGREALIIRLKMSVAGVDIAIKSSMKSRPTSSRHLSAERQRPQGRGRALEVCEQERHQRIQNIYRAPVLEGAAGPGQIAQEHLPGGNDRAAFEEQAPHLRPKRNEETNQKSNLTLN
jgi:hypothetical protein